MVTKSATAFRTISEVASTLDLPQHVLRFWETKFTVVRPLKRAGGRRYYRPEDVDLLRKIKNLLHNDGYTIKGVQKLLRDGGAKGIEAPPISGQTDHAPASSQQIAELRAIVNDLEDISKILENAL